MSISNFTSKLAPVPSKTQTSEIISKHQELWTNVQMKSRDIFKNFVICNPHRRVLHLNAKIRWGRHAASSCTGWTAIRRDRRYELKYQGNPAVDEAGRRLGCIELVHISMHIVATAGRLSPPQLARRCLIHELEPSGAENLRWNKVANPGSRPRARPKREQRRCIRITEPSSVRPSKPVRSDGTQFLAVGHSHRE